MTAAGPGSGTGPGSDPGSDRGSAPGSGRGPGFGPAPSPRSTGTSARGLLAPASVAVAFAAADTYVVVLALPDMMAGVGLSVDQLQRGAPIVSGFLLGYVAMLPLVGRIADLAGRLPVLVGSLLVFALGSLVTAAAYDLPSLVTGRFLQGLGGGGLVPATLALVADIYPAHRRGVPLGVVGAVQELGSVLGPLYGALVLAVAGWREIFWVNVAVGVVLVVVLRRAVVRGVAPAAGAVPGAAAPPVPTEGSEPPAGRRRLDLPSALLAGTALLLLLVVLLEPDAIATDVTLGLALVPLVGSSRWASPLGLALVLLLAALAARSWYAERPLVDLRRWVRFARRADVTGALLLAVALGGVVLAFASADPQVQALSPAGEWLLAGSAVVTVVFWWRNRRVARPLVPAGALSARPAWGSLVVSLFVGAALVAALVDIPVFARVTVYPDSQLMAALVLVRFLAALPVGALLGGVLSRRLPVGWVAAAGMLLTALSFALMAQWGLTSLAGPAATVPLVLGGLGFGLALAPVNAALLAATEAPVHGVASALLVVARMVGMLVGISALTTLGLRRYYAVQTALPEPAQVCGTGTSCPAYTDLLREAGLTQLHTIFVGAAACAVVAAVVALATFGPARTLAAPERRGLLP